MTSVVVHLSKILLIGGKNSIRKKYRNVMRTTEFKNLTMVDRAWLIHELGEFLMSIEYYDLYSFE